ncbi:MAG: hypothetical protein ACQKBY_01760 [Verrucomicrobiales bacterium]
MSASRFVCLCALMNLSVLHGMTTIMYDDFSGMGVGDGLNGRSPVISLVGGTWSAPDDAFLSEGSGAVVPDYGNHRTASIDLGSTYFALNPGVYTLTTTVQHTYQSNDSLVGFGFSQAHDVNDSIAQGTHGRPWMFYRLTGEVSVVAGGGTRPVRDASASSLSLSDGDLVEMSLVLDARDTGQYYFDAYIDGMQLDLNGASAGMSYAYGTTTAPRFVSLTSFVNGSPANPMSSGLVHDFTLSYAVPEPVVSGLLLFGGLGAMRRKR